jgi:hypothetical protein
MSREEVEQFVEATIGMPAELTKAIIRIESKGDQYAYNDDYYSRRQGRFVNGTYACGYMQLMPRGSYTYQEMMWNYGDALGINRIFGVESLRNTVVKEAPIGKNSDGSDKIGYTFTDEYVVAALNNCFNPYINITLGAMHMVQKVGISEAAMIEKHGEGFESFPYVFGYLHHFLGARPDLINAYFHNPDALAKTFVERGVVTRNHAMFYDGDGNPRTVKGMFEYMKRTGKMSDLKITDPNQFFWRQSVSDINLKVQGQIKDAPYMVAVPTTETSIASGGSARLALAAP